MNRPLSKPASFVRLRRCAHASDAHLRLCIWILRCALNDSYAVNCRFGSFARLASEQNTGFRERSNTQSGSSLIEAMLACTLGLFLILTFIQIYLSVKKTFDLQQAIVALQENGRFSAHFLSQTIRLAGYSYCNASSDFVNKDQAIQGYQNDLPDSMKGKVVKNTDSIVIGKCDVQDHTKTFTQLAFFIGATTRKTASGKTINALYEMPLNGSKRELVSDIDDMQIFYGVTSANGEDISDYLPASQVSDWHTVKSVNIALLLSSESPVLPKAENYEFMGETKSADRLLHREWDIYVALREP